MKNRFAAGGATSACSFQWAIFLERVSTTFANALSGTERIRILTEVGPAQLRVTFSVKVNEAVQLELRSHAEAKEHIPGEILAELESAEDSAEVESGVRQFIEWVKTGKPEVRVFPSAKVHAKVYIMTFVDGHIDKGRVVTGSSNFSESGLVENSGIHVESGFALITTSR